MKLVILFGTAAVGKMTVGHELARTTGLKLFHNHRSIDLVLNFFEYGTSEFWRLDSMFRSKIFDAVAAGELPGLIFTYMWALNEPGDKSYIDDLANKFSDRGGTVYKRNLAASEAMLLRHDKEFQQNTSEQRPFFYKSNFLKIDNTTLAAVEVAAIVKDKFDL